MTRARAVAFLIGSIVYLLWPYDIVPDFIPLVGWIEDVVLVAAAVWMLFKTFKAPSSAGPSPRPDPESDADAYKILGLAPGAGPEEIKRAFREQMALYHPDKVAHLGEDLKKVAHEKAVAIQEAYHRLVRGD